VNKPELKLAYQNGALLIIDKLEISDEEKDKLREGIDAGFDNWYEGMAPLFALVANSF
jgi:hypothetical protein